MSCSCFVVVPFTSCCLSQARGWRRQQQCGTSGWRLAATAGDSGGNSDDSSRQRRQQRLLLRLLLLLSWLQLALSLFSLLLWLLSLLMLLMAEGAVCVGSFIL